MGLNPELPILDPCLPVGLEDVVNQSGQTLHIRGQGDWQACAEQLLPLLAGENRSQVSLSNTYQAPIHFTNSEFYGFSEFYYCTDDVLRLGGPYHSPTFTRAAQVNRTEGVGVCDPFCIGRFPGVCGSCANLPFS